VNRKEIIAWVAHRLADRNTWSGLSLVVLSALVIIGAPIIKTLAWVGLAYGIYTMATQA
jgi:hypothetical protein